MIDKTILDTVLPIPDIQALKNEVITQLQEDGFPITYFSSGGIFNMLLMIILRIRIELIELLRTVLNNQFVSHATGIWLTLKAADFSKKAKAALQTQGAVTLRRGISEEAIKIPKGHVFKTNKDSNGDELRFIATQDVVLQKGAAQVAVPVEAEQAGSFYNVPEGQITRTLTHIEGGCTIHNESDWISREGSDPEDEDSLRSRILRSWAELSSRPIADKYQNVCEQVSGVLFVNVSDNHPRGQGTVDIIVTGTAGAATEGLLEQVRAQIEPIRGSYDDVLVCSSMTVTQPVTVTVTIPANLSDNGISEQVTAAITDFLQLRRGRILNELTHADIVHVVKSKVAAVRNVRVLSPAEDMFLSADKVILLGAVSVTVERV